MQLSKNFQLWELTKSTTAARKNISNAPNAAETANLKLVAENILQPVREHYGLPIVPTSGFRSKALNRAIGGSRSSQHMTGQAVDFEVPGVSNYELATWIKNNLEFDQVILEFYTKGDPNSGWVHCSYVAGRNRKITTTASSSWNSGRRKTIYQNGLLA